MYFETKHASRKADGSGRRCTLERGDSTRARALGSAGQSSRAWRCSAGPALCGGRSPKPCQRRCRATHDTPADSVAHHDAASMVRDDQELPKTPARQLARDVTGKRHLEGQPRAASPARTLKRDVSLPGLENADDNIEDPSNSGTILREKGGAHEYQGAPPDDPDPRVRWAARNGFTSRESFNDLKAILHLIQTWFIMPHDLRQEAEIDRGSFGSIFAGSLKDAPVAIKHVGNLSKGSGLSYPQIFRAMRLELSIASVLKHPNIVQFHGMSAFFPVDEKEDVKFYLGFVFELCSAGSLFSHIHRKGTFKSFVEKMVIARDIACGMSYVHEHNIVHRDLSTRNVLLTSNHQVKIADFGCARQIVGESYDSTTISGSPAYMSPEQLQGRMLTVKVDVWALGVCIWELLNEQIPWSDRNCNDRKALAKHVAVGGGRLKKTPTNKRTPAAHAAAADAIMEGAFQASIDKRSSMARMHQQLSKLVAQSEAAAAELAADEQRLETLLIRFYSKHNPAKLSEVADLARLFRGRENVLNDRLRSSYKVDLSNFEFASSSNSSGGSNHAQAPSDENEEEPPPSDVIAERLRLFYQHLNPTKMKVVPGLLKKFQGDYKGLNEELRQKYSMDLRTPGDKIKMLSSVPTSSSSVNGAAKRDSLPARGSAQPMENKSNGRPESVPTISSPRLARGGSAPPMRESPEKSINSWEAEKEPLLTFFYLQLNPSKVRDVSQVLRTFRNDNEGLNASLRKTYGIDLAASQEEIQQQAVARARESRRQAEAAALEQKKRDEEAKQKRQQAEAEAAAAKAAKAREEERKRADKKEEEARKQHEAEAAAARAAEEKKKQEEVAQKRRDAERASREEERRKAAGKKDDEKTQMKQKAEAMATEKVGNGEHGQPRESSAEDKQRLADIKGRLLRFYIAWGDFEPVDVDELASKYVSNHDALNALLRERFHGTDLNWPTEQIGQHCERLESESNELDPLVASLSAFYKAWDGARSPAEIKIVAQKYKGRQEILRQKLQAKYHGTDFGWSAAELIRKRDEIAAMEKEVHEAAMRQEKDSLVLKDLIDKLRQFYASWDVARSERELETLALKYQHDASELNKKLRDRYKGTDLSTDVPGILHIKAEKGREEQEAKENARMEVQRKAEEAKEAERREREQQEKARMEKQRQAEEAQKAERLEHERKEKARMEEQRKAEEAREAENLERERALEKQHAEDARMRLELIETLAAFYKAWDVCGKDLSQLLQRYESNVDGLNEKLRLKYHGTDLSTSAAEILALRQKLQAQEATKESIDELERQLREFYAHWNFVCQPSHDAHVREMAVGYHDKRAELCTTLRRQFQGTDLSSPETEIAAKQQSQAIGQLCQQLTTFHSNLNTGQMGEAESLARQYVGKRSQLNQVLREKYGVDLNSTEEALQQRREAIEKQVADPLTHMHALPPSLSHELKPMNGFSPCWSLLLQEWQRTVQHRLERFRETWAGHCLALRELNARHFVLQYSDSMEDLNRILRKQCHGMDLESSDADIRKRAEQLSSLAGDCFATLHGY